MCKGRAERWGELRCPWHYEWFSWLIALIVFPLFIFILAINIIIYSLAFILVVIFYCCVWHWHIVCFCSLRFWGFLSLKSLKSYGQLIIPHLTFYLCSEFACILIFLLFKENLGSRDSVCMCALFIILIHSSALYIHYYNFNKNLE